VSDFGTPEHTLRTWLGNDEPVYREVCRIAERDNRHDVRVREVRRLVTELLYGLNGMSSLRHLYRKTYGERRGPVWSELDEIRDSMTREEFEAIDWDVFTENVMDVTDAGTSAQ
jgi:hypothetical protein